MKILTALLACTLIAQVAISQSSHSKKRLFIEEIWTHARRIQIKYDVPYEVTVAVAIIESGWGLDNNANSKRNYLGIMKDDELREFDTHYEAFEYFGKLLSGTLGNKYLRERYKPLKYCKEFRTYCITLQSVGYSTGETYGNKLITIILENNLHIRP